MELDRISNLPSGITEKILSCLPLKDAVRTSVLSSQWRNKAAMLQHLVFDYQCRSAHSDTTFADIVDHVLLAHIGPIHKFELTRDRFVSKDMDRWILHLSRNSIKEFILRHWVKKLYKIPSCLFSCQDITSLELSYCLLKPPSTFKGFRGLKSLHFDHVIFSQDDVFEHLIISCPLLESLTLIYCDSVSHLMIDAPNLIYLYVRGSYKDVLLVNTSNLVDVSIGLEDFAFYVSQRRVSQSSSNLVKILSCMPQVQKLDFFCCSTMYLAIGALPVKLPRPCLCLNCLHITLSLSNLEESLTALCLFRSCPALQELQVQVFPGEDNVAKGNSWLDDGRKCSFSQLRSVFINDIRGSKPELDFIRYLLLNSPVLERMTVPLPGVEASRLEKLLLRSRRASVHSRLIFQDIHE